MSHDYGLKGSGHLSGKFKSVWNVEKHRDWHARIQKDLSVRVQPCQSFFFFFSFFVGEGRENL